jgi:hypothetical protein
MNFNTFLNQCLKREFWDKQNYFCFNVSVIPFLFFKDLLLFLSEKNIINFPVRYVKNIENFLHIAGNSSLFHHNCVFFLSDFVDNKSFSRIINNATEHGKVILFVKNSSKVDANVIYIGDVVDYEVVIRIVNLLCAKYSSKKIERVSFLVKKIGCFPLDFVSILTRYFDLVKVSDLKCFESYFLKMFSYFEHSSLFDLSKFFFSYKRDLFFSLWSKLRDDYSIVFWITYWSEQIWKAYNFVILLHDKKIAEAKKTGFGLPYTFLKNDYKNFSKNYLSFLYGQMYKIDGKFKQGTSFFCVLELFFLRHFNRGKG